MAGSSIATLAASAFISAFSAYVAPTSATPGSTAIRVRPVPASNIWYSPSFPALPVAMTSRRSAKRSYGPLLRDDQLFDALVREGQHGVQLRALIRGAFRRRLQLHQPAVLDHDAVQVRRGLEVFGVVEVQHRCAFDDAAAHGGEVLPDRKLAHHAHVLHALDRHVQRAERSCDGRGARASVRLQHVAVEGDGALADLAHVDSGAQGST